MDDPDYSATIPPPQPLSVLMLHPHMPPLGDAEPDLGSPPPPLGHAILLHLDFLQGPHSRSLVLLSSQHSLWRGTGDNFVRR
ncbi:unnamed protein product [Arabis nemorensis]|uniref:Uncharacterized protein n=1 Tax=Arabis nemorensis TaxID=586526 RepID=A0A565CML2_9BRAS|nr:unnamed protein product [Arabis nemorensis]